MDKPKVEVDPDVWDPNRYQGRSRKQVESQVEMGVMLGKLVWWAAIAGFLGGLIWALVDLPSLINFLQTFSF